MRNFVYAFRFALVALAVVLAMSASQLASRAAQGAGAHATPAIRLAGNSAAVDAREAGPAGSKRLPSLYISHGSPLTAINPGESGPALARLGRKLGKPRAVVVMSAHWESSPTKVTTGPAPATLHDFYGFPDELYKLRYPAPGSPELARSLVGDLNRAGVAAKEDPGRPFDHGCWVPLMFMYPDADVPVVQVSLPYSKGSAEVERVGRALAHLADQNVLLVGSGSITHNLGDFDRSNLHRETHLAPNASGRWSWASDFRDWVVDRLAAGDGVSLHNYRQLAPHAQHAHPRDEHLLPLFFARGAGGADFRVELSGFALGSLGMDIYSFS